MTNRILTDHITPGDKNSAAIEILVADEPGAGGANHKYLVNFGDVRLCEINFQNGPIDEAGINGVTQEVLLAVVADRLRSFQAGPFNSTYNAVALIAVESALQALTQRTLDRIKRNVEDTNVK